MTPSLIKRAIRPRDCTLAFGIPTSIEEYRDQRLSPKNHDFIFRVAHNETEYRLAVLDDVERLVPAIEQTGVRIERGLTVEAFGGLFRDPTHLVVTLFSHWNADSVEFADGMAPIRQIVDAVSPKYTGILDLCVCHPIKLVKCLKMKRPRITYIKHTNANASISAWLWFYLALFKVLQETEIEWLEAVEKTLKGLMQTDS